MSRYIATTHTHEHKFTISQEIEPTVLPCREFRAGEGYIRTVGWFDHCGPAYGVDCPTCGKYLVLRGNLISGTYSDKAKCDARCTSARGFNCECQCSGKNHGADYSYDPTQQAVSNA